MVIDTLLYPLRQSRGAEEVTVFRWTVRVELAAALAILNALMIVEGINLSHSFAALATANQHLATLHAYWIFNLEQRLHIAVEPLLQQRVLRGLQTPLGTL